METDEVCGRPLDAFAFASNVTMGKKGLGGTDDGSARGHSVQKSPTQSRERVKGGDFVPFHSPLQGAGTASLLGQGAKPLGSSNALVTRTAAGGIAANPDKSVQGCRTLPIASCRLRRAAQSCNQTQGDGSHPHTQARRRQSAEHTAAPSSGCASIPPAHSESAAQHPSSAHFRRAKPARTPPALGKQPEYSPAEGTARVEMVGIRGSRMGAVLGTAQSPNPRHRTP